MESFNNFDSKSGNKKGDAESFSFSNSNEKRTYDCMECTEIFVNRKTFKRHINLIHKNIWYHCAECDYSTIDNQFLESHVKIIHEGLRYKCNHCEFEAKTKSHLNVHVNTM